MAECFELFDLKSCIMTSFDTVLLDVYFGDLLTGSNFSDRPRLGTLPLHLPLLLLRFGLLLEPLGRFDIHDRNDRIVPQAVPTLSTLRRDETAELRLLPPLLGPRSRPIRWIRRTSRRPPPVGTRNRTGSPICAT